eukprot:1302423-Rhodomonas_salina.1
MCIRDSSLLRSALSAPPSPATSARDTARAWTPPHDVSASDMEHAPSLRHDTHTHTHTHTPHTRTVSGLGHTRTSVSRSRTRSGQGMSEEERGGEEKGGR